jgi:hypothetical protein
MNTNTYQIKQYRAWSYIKTINPDIIRSNITFSAQKNGGQWQMTLELSENFVINDYIYNDMVKVYVFNGNNRSGKLIYTWFVQEITQIATTSEIIVLSIVWVVWLLTNIMYKGATPVFNKNDTPVNIITDILSVYNTDAVYTITLWDTIPTPTSVNMDFSYDTCYSAINKVMDLVDGYRYVDQNQELHIRQTLTKHKPTYKKNIDSLEIRGDVNIYNRLYLKYNWTEKIYNELTSQWVYGIVEKKIEDTNIKNVWTADIFATERFTQNAYPKSKTSIVVTDQYDSILWTIRDDTWILDGTWLWNDTYVWDEYMSVWSTEYIEPWDGVRVNNFFEVVTGAIEKLTYNNWFVTLELEKSENFIKLLKE